MQSKSSKVLSNEQVQRVYSCCFHKLRNVLVAFAVVVTLFTISGFFFGIVGLHFSVVRTRTPSSVIYNIDSVFLKNINAVDSEPDYQKSVLEENISYIFPSLLTIPSTTSVSVTTQQSVTTLERMLIRRTPPWAGVQPVLPGVQPVLLSVQPIKPVTVITGNNDSSTVIQQTEQCRYLSGRSSTDGRWYNFSTSLFPFYAYSAIVDSRPSLLSSPILRIIALTMKIENTAEANQSTLVCALHYEKGTEYVPFEKQPRAIGYGWPINNVWFKEYVYSCPLGDVEKFPRAVSVVARVGDIINSCLPIDVVEKPTTKENFAACVQVTYDSPNPYQIIEWLELQRLLGVSLVGIYVMGVKDPAMQVLQHYAKVVGFVDLRFTESIGRSQQQYMLHGSPVINDCMYRYMYRFSRIVVIDFDEIIMPLQVNNLHDLVRQLDSAYTSAAFVNPPVNYAFNNKYFFLDLSPDISESPYLTFMRFNKHIVPSKEGYSVKSIVDPQACLVMHNHHCWAVTSGSQDRLFLVRVSKSVALNQHYKKCHLPQAECANLTSVVYEDTTVARFKPVLKQLVRDKVSVILRHNI